MENIQSSGKIFTNRDCHWVKYILSADRQFRFFPHPTLALNLFAPFRLVRLRSCMFRFVCYFRFQKYFIHSFCIIPLQKLSA